jgi:hypothetical protein
MSSPISNLQNAIADALAYANAISDNAIDHGETISHDLVRPIALDCNRIITALQSAVE